MTDLLLGLIALGALTTAVLQVIVILSLARTARRVSQRVERLRTLIAPIPAHLTNIRQDLARAQALANQQLGRIAMIYDTVEPPLRHGMAAFSVIKGISRAVGRARR